MTDLHTHILPGMDDGARNVEISLNMLRMEAQQGIHTVALTPHFYHHREQAAHFLRRRQDALDRLTEALRQKEERQQLPRLVLGAEVAWMPNLPDWPELQQLCYEGTRYLQLELPVAPWNDMLFRQLYDLMNQRGITPVIAHIDRYWGIQKKARLEELYALGLPMQLSAEALLRTGTRRKALRFLEQGRVQFVISDCHDTIERPPNLRDALSVVRKKLAAEIVKEIGFNSKALLDAEFV